MVVREACQDINEYVHKVFFVFNERIIDKKRINWYQCNKNSGSDWSFIRMNVCDVSLLVSGSDRVRYSVLSLV